MELMIETNNLVKAYKEQAAVEHVNLHIRKGSIYGLLGRNGAGKTTIMKMILGLTNATSGEIFIMGKPLKKHEHELYARIGVMLDTLSFYPNLTATENLQVFAKLRGSISRSAVRDALKIAGLPFADRKRFSEFSLGMKQRMGFANAIMHDPELLILDEPSNGLDPVGIVEMRKYIKMLSEERGKTIFIGVICKRNVILPIVSLFLYLMITLLPSMGIIKVENDLMAYSYPFGGAVILMLNGW